MHEKFTCYCVPPQLTRRVPTRCTPLTRTMRSCSMYLPCCPTHPTISNRYVMSSYYKQVASFYLWRKWSSRSYCHKTMHIYVSVWHFSVLFLGNLYTTLCLTVFSCCPSAFPATPEASYWEWHRHNCVPGTWRSPLHPQKHSLSLPARLCDRTCS